ncbi:hypothetical protein scyTo_0022805 [Scyliorhinus torazame]|uniref:Uncharacterized protein n=1 Tax=Scyliorhinus torazame TaxID=75743 RepID=A0A401Q836_SCYTO|nr:hypothetical protein [Scyliorhinus torazame]
MPSPLQADQFWSDVPIARADNDSLMEVSEVNVWSSAGMPPLVIPEDSSLDYSKADESLPAEGLSSLNLTEEDTVDSDAFNGLVDLLDSEGAQRSEGKAGVTEGGSPAKLAPDLNSQNGLSVVAGKAKTRDGWMGSPVLRRKTTDSKWLEQNVDRSQALPHSSTVTFQTAREERGRVPGLEGTSGAPSIAESWKPGFVISQKEAWAEVLEQRPVEKLPLAGKLETGRLRVTEEKLVQPVHDLAQLKSLRYFDLKDLENPLGLSSASRGATDPRSSWITVEEGSVGSSEEVRNSFLVFVSGAGGWNWERKL